MSNRDQFCPSCQRYIGHVPLSMHACPVELQMIPIVRLDDRSAPDVQPAAMGRSDAEHAEAHNAELAPDPDVIAVEKSTHVSHLISQVISTAERVLILELLGKVREMFVDDKLPPDPSDPAELSAWYDWFKTVGRQSGHNDALRLVRAMLTEMIDGKS